jgi:mRNA interferase MazF
MAAPLRGEVWMADLDPMRGHEQAGKRPCLVVSANAFNAGPAGLVIVLPLTTKPKAVRSHVAVHPPEGGVRKPSFIKCEDVRSIAVERLDRRLGAVSITTMEAVTFRLAVLMDL